MYQIKTPNHGSQGNLKDSAQALQVARKLCLRQEGGTENQIHLLLQQFLVRHLLGIVVGDTCRNVIS